MRGHRTRSDRLRSASATKSGVRVTKPGARATSPNGAKGSRYLVLRDRIGRTDAPFGDRQQRGRRVVGDGRVLGKKGGKKGGGEAGARRPRDGGSGS
jgi:hypothetical protein